MTDNNSPIDAFADINLDEFKVTSSRSNPSNKKQNIDKTELKKIAKESNFQSRQPLQERPKATTKTFSLFPDECNIIRETLKLSMESWDNEASQPTSSDIVRAALHVLSKQKSGEKIKILKELRGRGRK